MAPQHKAEAQRALTDVLKGLEAVLKGLEAGAPPDAMTVAIYAALVRYALKEIEAIQELKKARRNKPVKSDEQA
jgi:hypothetical protein